ncbi:hypothetical protein [Rhodococcus indonesiensis]
MGKQIGASGGRICGGRYGDGDRGTAQDADEKTLHEDLDSKRKDLTVG